MQEEKAMKLSTLPEEPAEGTEGSCKIVFRLPVSGERITRRFMLEDKVEILYDYISTLDLQRESASSQLVLFQSMPRKEFRSKEKSLKEEGLANAMLQIKEEE